MRLLGTVLVWILAITILGPACIGVVVAIVAPPLSRAGVPHAGEVGLVVSTLLGLLLLLVFVAVLLRRHPIRNLHDVRGQMEVEETRIMQEIYRSLAKMENRIESLETLLLERPRTGAYSEPAGRRTHRP